jgi:two-component system, sporulation sensor kinase A
VKNKKEAFSEEYMFSSNLLNEVFYQSRIPQIISSINFSKIQYNPAFCEFLGYSMDEIKCLSVEEVSYPDDMPLDTQLFSEILNSQREEYQIEKRYIHKSGQIKTGILTVSRVKEQFTGEEFILGQVLDITENKRIENELRNREEKYRLLAENSSDIIMMHKVDFSYIYISPSVKSVLGYEPEEMLGRSPREFVHQDDRDELREQRILSSLNLKPMLVTYRCKKKDGSYIWLESTIKGVFDKETLEINEIISVSRDIQVRMETNERLGKSEKLALVGQTAAAVAHEIRNPLTAIKGFIQLFMVEKEVNPAFLTIIIDELDRVESIISEFLSIAKPHPEKSVTVQIEQILLQVIQLLQTQALMKNHEINYRIMNASIVPVNGDPNTLKQVFINVIQNSLDVLEHKGRIEVSLSSDNTGVYIRIEDNGTGIPKERLSKLGEPFYSTKEKGTGLGLMTSYRIIENHRGKININSIEGEGTVVTIWLPISHF